MSDILTDITIKVLFTLNRMEEFPNMPDAEFAAGIKGLALSIKEEDPNDFDSQGEIIEDTATGYLLDRLVDAQLAGKLREQYLEELVKEEKYELLAKVK